MAPAERPPQQGQQQGQQQQQQQRVFTAREVQELADAGRFVYVCDGRVFDVDADALMHPGGRAVLEAHRGKDISEVFRGAASGGASHAHSRGARALLEGYCVGALEGAAAGAGGARGPAAAAVIDESKPLLPQVAKLSPEDYQAWVDAPSTGHPIMFENEWMERMTCTQWYVIPLLWLPVAGALMWRAVSQLGLPAGQLPWLAAVGVLGWQLVEYSLHRWVFHLRPSGPETIKLHFMLHGHHHRWPMDTARLVFPPLPAGLVMALFGVLLTALVPQAYATALLAGGIAGYVAYDTTHWALHSGAPDPFVTPTLRASHMEHHYQNDKVGYGISSTLYDRLFGTLNPDLKTKVQ
ncbi:fatty acid 2-hydroxylase [Raphidocelis subcapitata]|uniref:Fatty acid 2-hydroxylase n=1 Tax=Raphidocelis subcapitata TaxID=307507 RepID=A0A2V0P649_9CHLO|nr:fatty acid 2-hydroxylase [Raphidocelis subcapitata]|eukprot:GBF95338.1 fatty acid 2-hydroxylase [Raphidocelis subcapitata]